jgi:hypothetical protein
MDELRAHQARMERGLDCVLTELREISRGIHPAILTNSGLGPALKTLARRSALPVELELRYKRRLPEHVEVAAYYVVSEALTNAAKHAHASVVKIDVAERWADDWRSSARREAEPRFRSRSLSRDKVPRPSPDLSYRSRFSLPWGRAAAPRPGRFPADPRRQPNDTTAWFILLGLGLSPSWSAPRTSSWAKAQPRYRLWPLAAIRGFQLAGSRVGRLRGRLRHVPAGS